MNKNCRYSREQLLNTINEVSFAVDDIKLYLDTHPEDEKALEFFKEKVMVRNEALKEYAAQYGPLTIDTGDDACSRQWDWVLEPGHGKECAELCGIMKNVYNILFILKRLMQRLPRSFLRNMGALTPVT